MRKEIQLTLDEMRELKRGAKIQKEKYLSEHIRKCALKQNAEYIKHQFNDKPAPLSERMDWDKDTKKVPIMSKDDLIGTKNEENEL